MHRRTGLLVLLSLGCTVTVPDGTADTASTGDTGSTPDTDSGPDSYLCASDKMWTFGDRESPLMHPGGACIDCHVSHRGPSLAVGGTIYSRLHEPEDCFGAPDVTVVIVGDDGTEFTRTTNAAGNFYLTTRQAKDLVFPIKARVESGDAVRKMVLHQDSGDCNVCHSVDGDEKAPGRIRVP